MSLLGSNLRDCLCLLLLDVLLPICDVYGDISLVIPWYLLGHYYYAMSMMIPMILSYIFTLIKWWSFEEKGNMWWSWILVLLQLWTPWRAWNVMILLYKNDNQAQAKKKEMMRELSSIEPFVESVPAAAVMCFLWIHGIGEGIKVAATELKVDSTLLDDYFNGFCNNISDAAAQRDFDKNISVRSRLEYDNFCAIFDNNFGGPWWFFTTLATSALAASIGIAKFLMYGPYPILSATGGLADLLSSKFLTAVFASLLAMVAKAFCGQHLFIVLVYASDPFEEWIPPVLFVSVCGIPNLLLAITSTAMGTGWNINLVKVLCKYPAVLLLPVFTNFAVGPRRFEKCFISNESGSEFTVSMPMTAINTALTIICYILIAFIEHVLMGDYTFLRGLAGVLVPLLIGNLVAIAGFMYLNKRPNVQNTIKKSMNAG